MRYYILICRIYCYAYSFFGRLTSKVIIYINGKNIELFTFISLYCRNKCLCYFYNTSFLGTFKIWVDFFDYLAHIEKKREKMLIFQYKSIVSLIDIYISGLPAPMIFDWRIALSIESRESWRMMTNMRVFANGKHRWLFKWIRAQALIEEKR